MKRRLLITIKDRTKADELLQYGDITRISDRQSHIGFVCEYSFIPLLHKHPNIVEIKDSTMIELATRAFLKQKIQQLW